MFRNFGNSLPKHISIRKEDPRKKTLLFCARFVFYIYIFPDIELDLDQPCGKHHVAKKVIKTDTNIRESSRGTHSHCYIRCVHRGRLVSRVSAMQRTPRTARILSYVFFNHFTMRHAREYIYICNESEEPISKFSPRRRTKGERKKKKERKNVLALLPLVEEALTLIWSRFPDRPGEEVVRSIDSGWLDPWSGPTTTKFVSRLERFWRAAPSGVKRALFGYFQPRAEPAYASSHAIATFLRQTHRLASQTIVFDSLIYYRAIFWGDQKNEQ